MTKSLLFQITILAFLTFSATPVFSKNYQAVKADAAPAIDGLANENSWAMASWAPIDQLWLGSPFTPADFTGRYKAVWTSSKLYLLVEITDDVLSDIYPDPLVQWYDDDCVEVFLDEDRSGGIHQYNYNAFAYHVSTLYDVVDIGTDKNPHLYNDHIQTKRSKNGTVYNWEMEITPFTDAFVYGVANNPVVTLSKGKVMGFSLAYCDNDGGPLRESFIGSEVLAAADKNRSYIDASIFGTIELVETPPQSIDEQRNTNPITVYPNPAMETVTIHTLGDVQQIVILNKLGQLLNCSQKRNQADFIVSIDNLEKGMYFIKAIANSQQQIIHPFIKAKE